VAAATPAVSAAQSPTQDTAVGSGDVFSLLPRPPFPPQSFHVFGFDFNAASGPAGENPTGEVSPLTFGERAGFRSFTGNVTCLAVSGNRAAIGAAGIDHITGLPAVALMTVVDGGPANSGLDTFNAGEGLVLPPPEPQPTPDCPAASFSDQHAVTNGDIVVQDAPSKDDCKHGGWRNFPGFKDQGDCVSFVATGGKRPPGS
jgi:hypothetical protein